MKTNRLNSGSAEEQEPGGRHPLRESDRQDRQPLGDDWFFSERHFCLRRGATAFFSIAVVAGNDDVLPGRHSAL